MEKPQNKFVRFYVKRPLLNGLIVFALILGAFFGIKSYIERPQDLGAGLEYIGKTDYGCWFICDSAPASVYYFATNMTQGELKTYFKGAEYVEHKNPSGGGGAGYNFVDLYFKPNKKDKEFLIVYYDNTETVISNFRLKQTGKSYVVGLGDRYYASAKESLE